MAVLPGATGSKAEIIYCKFIYIIFTGSQVAIKSFITMTISFEELHASRIFPLNKQLFFTMLGYCIG